ncbi:MAG: exodeoxyribonuclease VII large subunit [Paludibacteraceae bacterium]
MTDSISLSELTTQIQKVIRQQFSRQVWIRAEIGECRENNGHCYLELIEKEKDTEQIVAKSRAVIWASTYRMLKPYFEGSTGQSLQAGINILVAVIVDYSGQYGFNLIVRDINPTFTIGEMAARRLEIVRKLENDGVMDMNKQLLLPLLPRRFAIVSSATAAGYDDFYNQLHSSPFVFYTKLFPAIMQGEQAEQSIIGALDKIYRHYEYFDAVIIIRGGGAVTDLSCFDSYNLALNCTQFPLPIIVGIGHTRDISILDKVAHTSVKTPTAAADFFVDILTKREDELFELAEDIRTAIVKRTNDEYQKLKLIALQLKQASKTGYIKKKHELERYKILLKNSAHNILKEQKNRLQLLDNKLAVHSPLYLLKQGYSITVANGKRILSPQEVSVGDTLTTYLQAGHIKSEVTDIKDSK